MDYLATSQEIEEWLKKRFQQKPQEQISSDIKRAGQRAAKYWDFVKNKALDISSQTVYDPETKKVLPKALWRKENQNNIDPQSLAMELAMNIGSGGLAGVTKKVPGSIKLSKIPKKVEKLELNPINLSKDMPNSLENTAWKGVKPNGVARAIEEINKTIKRKTKRPIKIRTTETGETVIEDGRHLLEGLRIMGVKKWPVQDVTAMYNPDLVKTARANVKYLRDKAGRYAGSKSLKTPTGKVNINQILNSIKKKRKF